MTDTLPAGLGFVSGGGSGWSCSATGQTVSCANPTGLAVNGSTSFTTSNRLTRHDGPASVLRAYTPAEMRRLSEWAGVEVKVYRHPFWRMAAVAKL